MDFSFCSWCSWTKWGRWVKLRFYLFVSGINQGNEGERWVQDFLVLSEGARELPEEPLNVGKWLCLRVTMQKDPSSIPVGSQFLIPVSQNLGLETVGAWNFVVLVEDSDTRGSSSITMRMEYLFAFQIWCSEPCVENRWGGGRKHYFVNFLPFKSALIVGGWGLVKWCRKSHLGLSGIASFRSRIFR